MQKDVKCPNCQNKNILPLINTTDLKGLRFGKLIICCFADRDKHGAVRWYCVCDCGIKTHPILANNIKRGKTTTCGCGERESQLKPPGQTSWTYLYRNHIGNSKTRNRKNEISREMFIEICTQNCFYCEEPPKKWNRYLKIDNSYKNRQVISKDTTDRAWILYNGIDRVDSSKGYIDNNYVPCCYHCNRSKSDLPVVEWIEYISRFSPDLKTKLFNKFKNIGIELL